MNGVKDADSSLVLSYLGLRKAIGIIGIALPFVLIIGKWLLESSGIQPSISDYYYTVMRGVFVGSLCAIGVFMMSYRGYDKRDDIAGDLACIFSIAVALFPTTPDQNPTCIDKLVGYVHYASAAAFFLTLAYFCLVLFRKTDPTKPMTRQKRQRNGVYFACGSIILACIALLLLNAIFLRGTPIEQLKPIFWLEAIAVLSFGVSWLTKGEAILKDIVEK
jgi:hypothetical protein